MKRFGFPLVLAVLFFLPGFASGAFPYPYASFLPAVFESFRSSFGLVFAGPVSLAETTFSLENGLSTTTPALCVGLTRDMRLGATDSSTGGEVSKLQDLLRSFGYTVTDTTGVFGRSTSAALSAFRVDFGLPSATGVNSSLRSVLSNVGCGKIRPVVSVTPKPSILYANIGISGRGTVGSYLFDVAGGPVTIPELTFRFETTGKGLGVHGISKLLLVRGGRVIQEVTTNSWASSTEVTVGPVSLPVGVHTLELRADLSRDFVNGQQIGVFLDPKTVTALFRVDAKPVAVSGLPIRTFARVLGGRNIPKITLVAPQATAQFNAGSEIGIEWTGANLGSVPLAVKIRRDDALSAVELVGGLAPTAGSARILLPRTLVGGPHTLSIFSQDTGPSAEVSIKINVVGADSTGQPNAY